MAQQPIDLGTLSLEQLSQLKQQLEEELQILISSYQQLRMVIGRFGETKECLKSINNENEGKGILVPMTSSLYVPGELADIDSVLVDIGTGYYVKQPVTKAQAYCDRKVKSIGENADQVQQVVNQKRRNLEAIMYVMQQKAQQQMAAQQGVKAV